MRKQSFKDYLMIIIAGCGLIGTCLGVCVNISGNFFTPIAEDLSVGRGSVSLTLTIYSIVMALSGMIAVRVIKKIGLKKTVLIGTILQALGTFLLAMCSSIWLMYLLNILRGIGSGLIGTVTVTIMINYWFNKNNALITSIAMGFSGIMGAILSPIISNVIFLSGWRVAYLILGVIIMILNLPALLLPISLKPQERNMKPWGYKEDQKTEDSVSNAAVKVSTVIFALVLLYSFSASFTTAMTQHFPGIAEASGYAATGALMISVCMVANTGGKVAIGALIDKVGARIGISIFAVLLAIGAVLLLSASSSAALLAASGLYGLAYSLATVAAAMLTREMFGTEQYSRVYPKVTLVTTIANALGTALIGFMYDGSGSYSSSIVLMLVMVIIAFITIQAVYTKHQAA